MEVSAWSRSLTPSAARRLRVAYGATPSEAVEGAEALAIHLALAPETYHLVSEELLKKLKRGALVVNMPHGSFEAVFSSSRAKMS